MKIHRSKSIYISHRQHQKPVRGAVSVTRCRRQFFVKWGASGSRSAPIIEAVMSKISTGISFVTNGVEMK
ncbi:MAG: DUF3124 domain-containing protein [Flavisolibacter sp.]|nr:DUF3124 domain-containing protein [Flavisolibacter sp.]MBD0351172.1 DUF3124 domain-containing protein [Flavisolibacter sp.]